MLNPPDLSGEPNFAFIWEQKHNRMLYVKCSAFLFMLL